MTAQREREIIIESAGERQGLVGHVVMGHVVTVACDQALPISVFPPFPVR